MTPCPSQHPKPLKPSRGRQQSSVVVPIAIPAIHLSYPSLDGTPSQIDVDNISYAYFTKYTIISTQTTYTNYYTSMSNPLTTSVTNQHLSQDTRASPPPSNHFFHLAHTRLCTGIQGRWLSRLRMNLSALNYHRFKYNFIPSSLCPCCGIHSETTLHFLFYCPTHRLARTRLSFRLESELELTVDNTDILLETILFGKHISPTNYSKLLDIVFQYMSSTGRFA